LGTFYGYQLAIDAKNNGSADFQVNVRCSTLDGGFQNPMKHFHKAGKAISNAGNPQYEMKTCDLNRSATQAVCFRVFNKMMFGILLAPFWSLGASGSKVNFDAAGNTSINGKPFFPIGIFSYSPDTAALDDMRKHGFNTIVATTEHHKSEHLDLMFGYGLRIICPPTDEWLEKATNHPGMLAWYLADEPEGHGQNPASLREKYLQVKRKDPAHPIALDHFLLDSLAGYKDAADLTMTSYYPLLAGGGPALENFAVYLEKSRAIHGQHWPHWPFIQIFGGPNTDGGKWKQPEPDEVRCLVYIALVHRAQGIFYFSYWPQAPKTWAAVGQLNREILKLAPWLLTPGAEIAASSTNQLVHVRAKQLTNFSGGLLLAVNTTGTKVQTELSISAASDLQLRNPLGQVSKTFSNQKLQATFGAYETWAYVWGSEPPPSPPP
jgi:hypothetical protein